MNSAGARLVHTLALASALLVIAGWKCSAAASDAPADVGLEADGTVLVPAQRVPPSSYLSPEARDYLNEHLRNLRTPGMVPPGSGAPPLLAPYLEKSSIAPRGLSCPAPAAT